MKMEHDELKLRKKELGKIVKEHKKMSYPVFVEKVKKIAKFLEEKLPDHINK